MCKKSSLKEYLSAALMSLAAAVGMNAVIAVTGLARYSPAYREDAAALYASPVWRQILYAGILMPVIEELIFRGALFRMMRKVYPFVPSMIVSSVIFGLYHGNLVQFVYAGAIGMLLARMYERFGTLAVPVVLHTLMNLASLFLTAAGIFERIFESTAISVSVAAVCACVFIFFGTVLRRAEKN